jgi:nucleotide-binding universal stress UspA family protein
MKDIIVGVDRSETARTAAKHAAELAAAYRANLHVVMCVERGASHEVTVGSDRFRTSWLADAEQFLTDVTRSLPHDQVTQSVALGDPAKMLCEEAERLEARAIVVGNRRAQGVSRVLGSVAGDVTKHAPCDVMVANTCNGNA